MTGSELLNEATKVNGAIKNLEDSNSSKKPENKEILATELSNLLYLAFVLSEHYRIELEDSFLQTVNDYMLKFVK
jgi:hypothetical protein